MTSETQEKVEKAPAGEPKPSYVGLLFAFLLFPVGMSWFFGYVQMPSVFDLLKKPYTGQCTEPNHVVLSFNDGPSEYNNRIRRRLQEVGGRTTFFVNGNVDSCIYSE